MFTISYGPEERQLVDRRSHPVMHSSSKIGSFTVAENIRPFEDYIKSQRLLFLSLSDVER